MAFRETITLLRCSGGDGEERCLFINLVLNVSSMGDLLKNIEELTNERDKLLSEVVTLRENLTKATDAAQQEIEAEKNKAMDMIAQVLHKKLCI